MNRILELRGKFNSAPSKGRPGLPTLPPNVCVNTSDVERLLMSLKDVKRYWIEKQSPFNPLVSICYKDVIAKSNRMGEILLKRASEHPNGTIVGAKFSNDFEPKHIITHYLDFDVIDNGIEKLQKARTILENASASQLTTETMDILNNNTSRLKRDLSPNDILKKIKLEEEIAANRLTKNKFCKIIRDTHYIDRFIVEEHKKPISEAQIITLYDVGLSKDAIISALNLQAEYIRTLDDVTWLVTPDQYMKIVSVAPYLVSMSVTDLNRIDAPIDRINIEQGPPQSIEKPANEPIIGVIDTLFDESSYFSPWVDYRCMVNVDYIEEDDFVHGTAVTSLIVDGPALNPHLNDGCGRFRVRHFGIAKHSGNSTASIMEKVRLIVETNKDIKVWNFSLGSPLEIDPNFISPEAMFFDELQFEHDIIFVVSGTNNPNYAKINPKIGAPADSINSLVVNAVSITGEPVKYARSGPVLYFYKKPDVSFFGGDHIDGMIVYSNKRKTKTMGTSYAAPWITRKLAYLIHIMGFPREVAKALILDSAAGWNHKSKDGNLLGFGVVPKHIRNILTSEKDEIRFVMHGISEQYQTYTYSIPVPMDKDKYPYIAKATLCYFPKCSRSQGVDYTNTEMDIQFGRMNKDGKITSIDNNLQGDDERHPLFEKEVRNRFRKWDNVKHISEGGRTRYRSRIRKSPTNTNWGISIKTKERLSDKSGKGLRFGIVITLREINGENRISEFVQLCRANNWYVEEVNIDTRIDTYEKAEETLVFDE